jgi:hypothetical protein
MAAHCGARDHIASRHTSPPAVICDNDLELEWSWDQENDGNIGDARIFWQIQSSQRFKYHVFLYCSWKLCCGCCSCPPRDASTSSFISKGGEITRKVTKFYNMITIRTLSLLVYFTDIAIYILGSMSWSSRTFCMVCRVIADPSLSLPSLCGVVSRVPILIGSPWVFDKWVDVGWSESYLSVMNLLSTQFRDQILWHQIIECFFIELIE